MIEYFYNLEKIEIIFLTIGFVGQGLFASRLNPFEITLRCGFGAKTLHKILIGSSFILCSLDSFCSSLVSIANL